MSRLTKQRSKKQGSPPGTLVFIGEKSTQPQALTLINYTATTCYEKKGATLSEALQSLNKPSITWIHISSLEDPKTMETLGARFQWNPLVMEDILNTGQRPKCDDYRDYLYVVLRIFSKKEDIKIEDEQFSLLLGKNYVVTFMERSSTLLDPIRYRMAREGSRMRAQGADYLAYAIIDAVVDSAFTVLEKIDDEVDRLEEELNFSPLPSTLHKIQRFKREIAVLRKNLWPMREAVAGVERKENNLVSDNTRFFLRDVHDHTVLMIETIEGFRDILSGMLDVYLSNISLKMNEVMKVLTIVSTIFVPLTFIASIYGMNFQHMPELNSLYGYPVVIILMASVALFMLIFFRKKNWI